MPKGAPKPAPLRGDPAPPVPASAGAHVRAQVACMQAGDFAGAFGRNSPANRARLGDAQQFEAIVQGTASFAALAQPGNRCEFGEEESIAAGRFAVRVRAHTVQETYSFVFDVCETKEGDFATDGVRIEC